MKKQIVATMVGGIALFAWGMISWMLLPWHDTNMKNLPQEQLITDTVKTVVVEPGIYLFPSDKTPQGRMSQDDWVQKYKQGPVGLLVFSPQGYNPMGFLNFLIGLVGDFVIAFLVVSFLGLCRERVRTTLSRVKISAGVGFLASVAVHIPYWNWFHFPMNYTIVAVFDTVVGFALLGLVVSRFITE